jgi:hypothetical protein
MGPHRVNIINALQLIASPSDQLEYQSKAPVNVARELVNQWFDDFYHPADSQFMSEFDAVELQVLADFNAYYDSRVSALPDSLPELLQSSVWKEVMLNAEHVLAQCGWGGLDARYDC